VALVLALGASWAGSTYALERVARWAEAERGHYLWGNEEWLEVFAGHRFSEPAGSVILFTGASEAREAFLVEDFTQAHPTATPIQAAQSLGTMSSVLLQLELLERLHGEAAHPDVVVVGLSPRLLFNDPEVSATPLFQAVNLYSARFSVQETAVGYMLSERGWTESARAWFRFTGKQGRRFKNALRAAVQVGVARIHPGWAEADPFLGRLDPYKYHHLDPLERDYWAQYDALGGPKWDISPQAQRRIEADALQLKGRTDRMGARLVLVMLPEGPWAATLYREGFQDDLLALVASAYPGVGLLDLTHSLDAEFFFDHAHLTKAGADRTTRALLDWMGSDLGAAP